MLLELSPGHFISTEHITAVEVLAENNTEHWHLPFFNPSTDDGLVIPLHTAPVSKRIRCLVWIVSRMDPFRLAEEDSKYLLAWLDQHRSK